MGKFVHTRLRLSFGANRINRAVVSSQEPSVPVHLQAVWDLSPERVGVVFIAAVVPTLFCTLSSASALSLTLKRWYLSATPLSGYLSDKRGTEWTTALCLLLSIPWFVVMILESHLALFIVAFGLASRYFRLCNLFKADSLVP